MKKLAVSALFQKQLGKLQREDRHRVLHALKQFRSSLASDSLSRGLGLKKINHDKYEIRAGLKIRVVMKLDEDTFVCHLVGDHEDVRRYLRMYRSK